jgi:hypothetical protein
MRNCQIRVRAVASCPRSRQVPMPVAEIYARGDECATGLCYVGRRHRSQVPGAPQRVFWFRALGQLKTRALDYERNEGYYRFSINIIAARRASWSEQSPRPAAGRDTLRWPGYSPHTESGARLGDQHYVMQKEKRRELTSTGTASYVSEGPSRMLIDV